MVSCRKKYEAGRPAGTTDKYAVVLACLNGIFSINKVCRERLSYGFDCFAGNRNVFPLLVARLWLDSLCDKFMTLMKKSILMTFMGCLIFM
jgi:hypothetical protein